MTDEISPEGLKKIPPEAAKLEARAGRVEESPTDGGIEETKLLNLGLSEEDLEARAEKSEFERAERFKDHFEIIAMIAMWGISIAVGIFGFTWFWHVITPHTWHWLEDDQVEKIQNIFAGVVIAGLLTDHFKKRLS